MLPRLETLSRHFSREAENQMPKGNPNPSPSTRFSSEDNPARGRGRQKGARDRLSAAFLTVLADDFEAHGKGVVATVRKKDPSTYMRVMASLLPKEIELRHPLDELSDEDIAYLIATLKEIVPAPAADDAEPAAGTTPTIN
jgi:hypothetical protein